MSDLNGEHYTHKRRRSISTFDTLLFHDEKHRNTFPNRCNFFARFLRHSYLRSSLDRRRKKNLKNFVGGLFPLLASIIPSSYRIGNYESLQAYSPAGQ